MRIIVNLFTHPHALWQTRNDLTIMNTRSWCPPFHKAHVWLCALGAGGFPSYRHRKNSTQDNNATIVSLCRRCSTGSKRARSAPRTWHLCGWWVSDKAPNVCELPRWKKRLQLQDGVRQRVRPTAPRQRTEPHVVLSARNVRMSVTRYDKCFKRLVGTGGWKQMHGYFLAFTQCQVTRQRN